MQSVMAVVSMTRKSLFQDLQVGEVFDQLRRRIGRRVGIVNAVDLGGLEDRLGADLDGAQGSRRIGRKIGIAGAGGKNDHAALLQVADGPAADVRFGDLLISIAD